GLVVVQRVDDVEARLRVSGVGQPFERAVEAQSSRRVPEAASDLLLEADVLLDLVEERPPIPRTCEPCPGEDPCQHLDLRMECRFTPPRRRVARPDAHSPPRPRPARRD